MWRALGDIGAWWDPQHTYSHDPHNLSLDLIYGGHDADAWKFLDAAWPAKVSGKDAFAREFRAQLAKSPYWPEVKAMNAKPSTSPTSARADAE